MVAEEFEVSLVGIHRCVFVAAVEPFIHGARVKRNTLLFHTFERTGELIFALIPDVMVDEVL